MSDIFDIIADHIPDLVRGSEIVTSEDRAKDIVSDLNDNGYCIVRHEVIGTLLYSVRTLGGLTSKKLTAEDRRMEAESTITTIDGGFYQVGEGPK
jgi:hypothetical protein